VQTDLLDQGDDLGLRVAEQDLSTFEPQAASQSREIEHQRGVGKHQSTEVDDNVGLRSERAYERPSATSLGRLVLVSTAAQRCWLFVEVDDPRNLPKAPDRWQAG
jgi:hypothetical protein